MLEADRRAPQATLRRGTVPELRARLHVVAHGDGAFQRGLAAYSSDSIGTMSSSPCWRARSGDCDKSWNPAIPVCSRARSSFPVGVVDGRRAILGDGADVGRGAGSACAAGVDGGVVRDRVSEASAWPSSPLAGARRSCAAASSAPSRRGARIEGVMPRSEKRSAALSPSVGGGFAPAVAACCAARFGAFAGRHRWWQRGLGHQPRQVFGARDRFFAEAIDGRQSGPCHAARCGDQRRRNTAPRYGTMLSLAALPGSE